MHIINSSAIVLLLSVLLNTQAIALDVPEQISSIRMLDNYEKYLKQSNNRAFAISSDGYFGASWNWGSEQEAIDSALGYCRKSKAQASCEIINVNGSDMGTYVDAKTKRQTLQAEQQRIWPRPQDNAVPKDIADNPRHIEKYEDYLAKTGHKSFAISDTGAWGYSTNMTVDSIAIDRALARCNKNTSQTGACRTVDVNNRQSNGDEHTSMAVGRVNLYPSILKTYKELAKFKKYMRAKKPKALAISSRGGPRGAIHYSAKGSNLEQVKSDALAKCDKYTVGECRIVAVNNKVSVATEDADSLQVINLKPISASTALSEIYSADELKRYNKKQQGHRAVAANGTGAVYETMGYLTRELAISEALSFCERFAKLKKDQPLLKPCKLVAADNEVYTEVIDKLLEK